MKIHEYQAKAILSQYHVPVPRGEVAFTAEEAEVAAKHIGGSVVVKAQIHAGGRGKGGGVKVAKDAAEAMNTGLPCTRSSTIPRYSSRSMGSVSSISSRLTIRPAGPVWCVTSRMPTIFRAISSASAALLAT